MKRHRVIVLSLVLLSLLFPAFSAPVDPKWYDIVFTQGSWLASNTHNIPWGGEDLYVGHVDANRTRASSKAADYDPNLTLHITSPTAELKLQHISDPTKSFPIYLRLPFSGNTNQTFIVNESPFDIPVIVNWYSGANIYLNIGSPGGSSAGYEGTYTTYFRFRMYADYGTPDELLLEEMVMNLMMYYITPTSLPPGETAVTNLYLTRYPSADNIDLPAMQLNQSSLVVGTVDFQSNDSSNQSSYSLRIEPYPEPLGTFTFTKSTGNALPIPYKVHLTGRTSPATGFFTTNVPSKGPAGYWQDWIELAISGMNYTAVPVTAGTYTSIIRINLIKN
jgi:hypothetical protein